MVQVEKVKLVIYHGVAKGSSLDGCKDTVY